MEKFEHGGDVYRNDVEYDFSINVNPFGMPEKVKKALIEKIDLNEKYPDDKCEELINSLSRFHNVKKEFIICGNGASEIINNVIRVLKPKKALLMAPTFSGYEKSLINTDAKIDYYYLNHQNNFEIKEDILNYITNQVDIIFLCNPNNPVGNITSNDLLFKIIKKCRKTKTFIVVDECFLPFVKDYDKISVVSLLDKYNNLFILNAFTKLYAIPGLRLGYGLTSNTKLVELLKNEASDWNVSMMAQIAGVECLKEVDYVESTLDFLTKEQRYMQFELSQLVEKVYEPKANFIFFESIPNLREKLLYKKILIRSCENYEGLNDKYYRVAIRKHDQNIKLIEALREVLGCQKI